MGVKGNKNQLIILFFQTGNMEGVQIIRSSVICWSTPIITSISWLYRY